MSASGKGLGARIEGAAAGIDVSIPAAAAERLAGYLEAMLEANRSVNLTAVRDLEQAVVLHVVDSLVVAKVVAEAPRSVLDFGTGNGFPGVVAKVLWPEARVVLCDRTRKKVIAVAGCLAASGIAAETLWLDLATGSVEVQQMHGGFDLVLARAVGAPREVALAAGRLVAPGGRLVLWVTDETVCPERLAGRLRREGAWGYRLPAPVERERRMVWWRSGG